MSVQVGLERPGDDDHTPTPLGDPQGPDRAGDGVAALMWDLPSVIVRVLVQTGTVSTTTSTSAPPGGRPTKARHVRSNATATQVALIASICVVAGIVAMATATASPTGSTVLDALYRGGLVTLTTIAGSRARRWSVAVGAGIVTVGAAGWWGLAGVGALGITFALAWENRRHRVGGALAGALIGSAALHLGWPRTTFMTAILATAATTPMLVSAYRTSSRAVRRRVRIAALAVALLCLAGFAGLLAFTVTQRSNVESAIHEALGAADRIGSPSRDASTIGFAAARQRLETVAEAAGAPWMLPARALPVIGINVNSIRESAAAGAALAGAAERVTSDVDYRRLHRPGGGIDLAVLESFRAPLTDADDALAASDAALRSADSPFLVAPVAERMASLSRRVSTAHHDATTARMGAQYGPAMLGGSGDRRYLLLLGNPAEARDLGGHLGNWAEVVASGGHLRVVRVGEPYDMFGPSSPERPFIPNVDSFPRSLTEMNPTLYPQNWGATPDFPTVARLATELYPQVPEGGPVDGVIYADTKAFAAALAITGPIPIPGTDQEVDSAGAAEFLERGQYSMFERASEGDRAVSQLVRDALGRLLEGRLPAPDAVAANFGPAVDDGHLRFIPTRHDESAFTERLGLEGAVQPRPGEDLLMVINRNVNPSKIDSYLQRSITDDVTFDPATGEVHTRLQISLTNSAPASGLPKVVGSPPPGALPGTNRTELAVLTPFRATKAMLDGDPVATGTRADVHGLDRHSILVELAPGQTRVVEIDLQGRVQGPDYRLKWIGQALANPETALLSIRSTGAVFTGGDPTASTPLTQGARTFTFRTDR